MCVGCPFVTFLTKAAFGRNYIYICIHIEHILKPSLKSFTNEISIYFDIFLEILHTFIHNHHTTKIIFSPIFVHKNHSFWLHRQYFNKSRKLFHVC